MAGNNYHNDNDYRRYEQERAARNRRRAELRRKQARRRHILYACIAVLLLVIVLVPVVNFMYRGKNKKTDGGADTVYQENTVQNENGTQTGLSSDGNNSDGAVTVSGDSQDDGSGSASSGSDTASTDTAASEGVSGTDVMSQAQLMAAQYDYDGAISLLQEKADSADSSVADAINKYTDAKANCYAVDVTTVPHVFFHSLINDDRAFDVNTLGADRVRANNAAMTTVTEFNTMIEDMYEAGYVLVSLDDLCVKTQNADGTTAISKNTSLMLPQGKKALIMSEDDLSYYHSYGIGTQGYATKMVLDENGKPKCEYTDENGETHIGDYDMVPLIDSFIEQHPDFSYHGARPTVALTGYNGVLGYRTNDYYKDINDPHLDPDQIQWLKDHPDYSYEQDCADATAIAEAMKAEGWTFASHTYGHLNATDTSAEKLQADNERWKIAAGSIVGPTDKIIFAFGADIGQVGGYTEDNQKFTYFRSQGFDIFCNVDGNIGWTEFGKDYMRTGRVALDGYTMYQAMNSQDPYASDYEKLGIHDVSSFFNSKRPTPITSE